MATASNQKNPYPPFHIVLMVLTAAILINASLKYIGGLGQNNAAEKEIYEYATQNGFQRSDYPDELVSFFKHNEETKEFVLAYPSKIVNFRADLTALNDYEDRSVPPQLVQWDLRWGYLSYGDSVMGLRGSAPTALSMAAVYVQKDDSLTPVQTAKLAVKSGWEEKPKKLLSDGARSMGLTVKELPVGDRLIRQALGETGSAVVCLTDGKGFSQAVVIRGVDEEGKFLLNDTVSRKRSEQSYTFQELGSHLKAVWQYTKSSQTQ